MGSRGADHSDAPDLDDPLVAASGRTVAVD